MPRKRKDNYKFEIDQDVRYEDKKARVLERWWDNATTNRYLVRFVIGTRLVGDGWCVIERDLQEYTK